MIKGKYLSDEIESIVNELNKNQLNFIQADTGQGKTVAAIHTIPDALHIAPNKVLILIDTNAGKDNKISAEGCKVFGSTENKPTIMTYAEFGTYLKSGLIFVNTFDYIGCDEVHNLAKYARIDQSAIVARNPNYDSTTIAMILTRESLNYRVFDTLKRWSNSGSIWLFGFSATPRLLEDWNKAEGWLNKIRYEEQLIVYEVLEKYEYKDIHKILTENPNHKRLIHAPTIGQVESFVKEIKDSTGRNAIGLWSKNSKKLMDLEQTKTLETITQDEKFPLEVDDVVATEAYSTGYNIKDESVKEIIVHTGNKDIQIQFKGRKRDDLPILKVYNSKKNNRHKKLDIGPVPNEFLDKKLDKKDKQKLREQLGYCKGWTSLKKQLKLRYDVESDGHGGDTIREKAK